MKSCADPDFIRAPQQTHPRMLSSPSETATSRMVVIYLPSLSHSSWCLQDRLSSCGAVGVKRLLGVMQTMAVIRGKSRSNCRRCSRFLHLGVPPQPSFPMEKLSAGVTPTLGVTAVKCNTSSGRFSRLQHLMAPSLPLLGNMASLGYGFLSHFLRGKIWLQTYVEVDLTKTIQNQENHLWEALFHKKTAPGSLGETKKHINNIFGWFLRQKWKQDI